jgi:hypothetical protein
MAENAYRAKWVAGLDETQRLFRALPDDTKAALNVAIEETAVHILAGARQRVAPHRRYGFLERYLGLSMNPKIGEAKVGLPAKIALVFPGGVTPGGGLKITQRIKRTGTRGEKLATFLVMGTGTAKGAQVIRPSKYAHLVEFGHARGGGHSAAPPSPFMIPAAEAERTAFPTRCKTEMERLEARLAAHPVGPAAATVGSRYL